MAELQEQPRFDEIMHRIDDLEMLIRNHNHRGYDLTNKLINADISARRITQGGVGITVNVGESIQQAINEINNQGGGTVYLVPGTHYVTSNIILYNHIYLKGVTADSTIINFSSTASQILINGSGAYSGGTVSVSFGGTTVTGSSTSWLANVSVGQSILLEDIWYTVAAVATDTSLTINIPYGGRTLSGATYVAATLKQDIKLSELTITASATTAISAQYVTEFFLYDLNVTASAGGLSLTDASNINFSQCDFVANNTGVTFTRCYLLDFLALGLLDTLVGNGLTMNTCRNMAILDSFIIASAGDGINLTSCEKILFDLTCFQNVGQGIEFVSGNSDMVMLNCAFYNNGSDGVKLTATSDNIVGVGMVVVNNGGYGVNIAASSCDNNKILGSNFSGNTTAAINDLGVGTQIDEANAGIATVDVK